MKRNTAITNFNSSFLSCEKDIQTILRKLFIDSKPKSDELKRLLIVNSKDCLTNNSEIIIKELENMSLAKLVHNGYIKLSPKLKLEEHAEVKSYIIISMDNFTMNKTNPQFRDCTVNFDIICNLHYWDLGDYQIRPIKIAGYIDGILNEAKLSGIGTFNFVGCSELVLNETFAGYSLSYRAIHGTDDRIENE